MGRRYSIAYDLNNMVPAPAGVAIPKTIFKSEDGILLCYGITMPEDNSAGYAPGCLFLHTDGTNGTALYVNEGTAAAAGFKAATIAD